MDQFNLGNFINRFINKSFHNVNGFSARANPQGSPLPPSSSGFIQNSIRHPGANFLTVNNFNFLSNLRMNNLSKFENSIYLKDLMNLPKDMQEVLLAVQNKTVQGEELAKILNKNININLIAELIQQNGKEAINKLILVMSNASKQGMNDLSQFKETIKLINASVAVASQENPSQILKSFMLLYLPWLPLQEGVDFELEIESSESEENGTETIVTILISTINFGNVKAMLLLKGINSIDIFINCSDDFPKEELLKRINIEAKNHSIQSSTSFEQKENKNDSNSLHQAKVSMSKLTEVNPYLLLMTNAVIKHTVDIDNTAK